MALLNRTKTPPSHRGLFSNRWARQLARTAFAIAPRIGFERSLKLRMNALEQERFLLSVGGAPTGNELVSVLSSLDAPEDARRLATEESRHAAFFHLGYEGDAQGGVHAPVVKLYFERPQNVISANEESAAPVVHTAVKWRPGDTAARLDIYRRRFTPPQQGADNFNGAPFDFMVSLYQRATQTLDRGEIFMLDILGAEDGRRSIDLRLYDLDLTLKNCASQIVSLAEFFGCSGDMADLLSASSDETLGHAATGKDAAGAEFFTLYFGVKELVEGSALCDELHA